MKNKILIFIITLNLFGCTADQMSKAQTHVSQFDGSKSLKTRPMHTFGESKWVSSGVMMGANWDDSHPSLIIIEAELMNQYENLDSLTFKIDGKLVKTNKLNLVTDLKRNEYFKSSSQKFALNKEDAKLIVDSKNTLFKLTTLSGKYYEGAVVLNGDKSMAYKSIINVIN